MVIHHQNRTGKPFESQSIAAWKAAVGHGVALDIGAYTGLYAIIAAKAGSTVYAFEPNPAVLRRLIENAGLNQVTLSAHCQGVSDHRGSAALVTKSAISLTSGGRLVDGNGVDLVRVDDLNLAGITAIKIDVEGHECAVLRGAFQAISRDKPVIITEALNDAALQDQRDILEPIGYQFRTVDQWNVIWRV